MIGLSVIFQDLPLKLLKQSIYFTGMEGIQRIDQNQDSVKVNTWPLTVFFAVRGMGRFIPILDKQLST